MIRQSPRLAVRLGFALALLAGRAAAQPVATNVDPTAPTTPNFVHAAGLGPATVYLKWSPSAAPAVGSGPASPVASYQVFRDGALVTTTDALTLNWTDGGLAADTSYSYEVVAVNQAGETSAPAVATAATLPELPPVTGMSAHPRLVSAQALDALAAGGPAWSQLQGFCDAKLNQLVQPGYAGWDWRDAAVNYATCYQVAKRRGELGAAAAYAGKSLGLLAVLARHHNGGTPDATLQPLAQGDGSTVSFSLPFAPMDPAQVAVELVATRDAAVVRSDEPSDALGFFAPILKVGNAPGGSDYATGDWQLRYRDEQGVHRLGWPGAGPAPGATYHVTVADGAATPVPAGQFVVDGTTLTLATAPTAAQTVMVRYLGADREQTGNGLGGVNAVQPDGPGYPMRTFNVGLALGYDLLHDVPAFTSELKAEFLAVLNAQVDWYKAGGYERNGDIGNYFVRGYLMGTFATAWATDNENPRAAELKTLANELMLKTYGGMARYLPGGYGPQGTYANGTTIDVAQILSLYEDVTGFDLLDRLEWTDNVVAATIHGTKPDLATFYDGGDWNDLPAVPLTGGLAGFLQYRPDHPSAPFARHLLGEAGEPVPGIATDYRSAYPPAWLSKVSGPAYSRSDWGLDAVWMSFAAAEIATDHVHRDQGHLTINRGGDRLLVDSGGYDFVDTRYHNTFLIDDQGAGDLSVYPPAQGWWGEDAQITRFADHAAFTYVQADYGDAYVNNDRVSNSVRRAARSVLFLRPDTIVVFDQVQTAQPGVRKTFNLNFGGSLESADGVHKATVGDSALFLQTVLPIGVTPVVAPLAGAGIVSTNFQETKVGNADDTFLHVFHATGAAADWSSRARLVRSVDGRAHGVEVAAGGTLWTALFAAYDQALGGPVQYLAPTPGARTHVVADLLPNHAYVAAITDAAGTISRTLDVATDRNGKLTFQSDAGESAFYLLPGTVPPASVPPIDRDPNAPVYTPPLPTPGPGEAPRGQFPPSVPGRYVAMVSPTNGEAFSAPLGLRLVAAAFDANVYTNEPVEGRGTNAAKVQFYVDDTLVLERYGDDAEYNVFKGFAQGLDLAPGEHVVWARATYVDPPQYLDSEPFTITVQQPAYAQTVELTADVVIGSGASYALSGTSTSRIRLNANGYRIVSDGTAGSLTLRHVDVHGLGSPGDVAVSGLDVAASAAIVIEDSIFDASNGLRLRLDGDATASVSRNLFRSNMRMPIGQQPDVPSTYPVLAVGGSSAAPKVFAGNNVAAGPVVFEQVSHWLIGGDTDADTNVLIGPRTALELRNSSHMTVRGNFVHHDYYGGWSQGQLLELHGTAPILVEHNVLMDSSWPVRGIAGEFRYNLVLQAGHEWLVPSSGAFIHHNVFAGGDNDRGGITGFYDVSGVRIENNTFDLIAGGIARAGLWWLAGETTLRSNAFLRIPAGATGAVEIGGGTIDADYNAFLGAASAAYTDGRTPQHDLNGGVSTHPKLRGPMPAVAYDFDRALVWKRQLPVSAVLSDYRARYTPTALSSYLEAGDPAAGPGNDIGAVGAGVVHALDRFGSFSKPGWTPPPTPETPQNEPPMVTITSPASGASYGPSASIDLVASAEDADGTVIRVEFFVDGSLVVTDTQQPWQATVSGLAVGGHAFTARAFDDSGASTLSSAVAITITNATPPPPDSPPTDVGNHGENLLADPGFETGIGGFWAQYEGDLLERVSADPVAGSGSLRMTVNGSWDNFWSSVNVENSNLSYGSRLTLSAKVRTETASGTRLELCAAFYYLSGAWAQGSCVATTGGPGDVETLTSTVVVNPAEPLRVLHFFMKTNGAGPVAFTVDDVSMVLAAPDAEPDPEEPPPPSTPPVPPPAYGQNLIGDPGFESGLSTLWAQNEADVLEHATTDPVAGAASVRMVVNGGWDNFWFWRTVEGTSLAHAGQLVVSAKVRAETPAESTRMRLCAALYYADGEWAESPACAWGSGVAGQVDTLTSSLVIDPARPLREVYFYLKGDGPGGVVYAMDDVSLVLWPHAHGHNLVADGGFESGTAGLWPQNDADLVEHVTADPVSGSGSARITVNGGWDNFWLWSTVEGTNLAYGGQLTVAAKVRADGPAAATPLRLCAALYYADGGWVESPVCGYGSGVAGTVETIVSTLAVDPTRALRELYFYLKADGPGGVVYTLDDASLVLSAPAPTP